METRRQRHSTRREEQQEEVKTRLDTIVNPDVKNLIEAMTLVMNMNQKVNPRIMPDNYFGENRGEWRNVESWMQHFEQVYHANGAEDEKILTQQFTLYLKGSAAAWYQLLHEDIKEDYTDLLPK